MYIVSCTLDNHGSDGQARNILNELLDVYFSHYSNKHINQDQVTNQTKNLIQTDYDYLEMVEAIDAQLAETIDSLHVRYMRAQGFRSIDTGYSFAWKNYQRMVNAFGICEEMYVGEDNKVHYGFIEDAYLDFLTLSNRWYEMGILDPDGFTQEIDAFYAKIATGRTGLVWGNTGGELGKIETMKADNLEIDYQPAPNPVLNKGDSFPVDISAFRVGDIGAMVSANCENKEAAAKVVDYVYGKEGDMLANFGVEGVTYEMVDGKPQFTEYVLNNPDGLSIQTALSFYAGDKNKSFLVD